MKAKPRTESLLIDTIHSVLKDRAFWCVGKNETKEKIISMKIFISKDKLKDNLYSFMRRCRYRPLRDSYVRSLSSGDYPRFHLHIEDGEKEHVFNLHLDQKKPSYGKEKAHSGEYKGELVEQEAERIKELAS